MTPDFFYFDLGKVLVGFDIDAMVSQMAAVAGVTAEAVEQAIFASGMQVRLERGGLTNRQFHDEFCRLTGAKPDYDDLEVAGADIFTVRSCILPIVSQMHQAGYRLGVLSNTCRSHWEHCLRRFRIMEAAFDVYAMSFEIRHAKPESKIYHAAAELAGVEPGRIFFTDDRQENIDGALAAGFDAMLYTSTAELAAALRQRGVRFNY